MIKKLPKSTHYQILRNILILGLTVYAVGITIAFLRSNPLPLVIGIDSYGTRIVSSENDSVLKLEKNQFVRQFVNYLYSFDETNFDDRISLVGDLMSESLWEKKKAVFTGISNKLKEEPMVQKGQTIDLREIDETHFEADVDASIQSRLRKSTAKVRVQIEIGKAPRTTSKPYPWEVIQYDEQVEK